MRTPSRARVLFLLTMAWALVAATASAQDVLYFRVGGVLSPEPPAAGATTVALSTRIPAGENALLATFTSAPMVADLTIAEARTVVFLGTGRPGMDGCARVTTSLARLTGAVHTVVASGDVVTSIRPRRKVTDPILVPMSVAAGLVVAAGDRLVLDVRVANECGGERNVSVLYDSLGRASRVELVAPGATTTTTTTSTTTTTLPATCLDTATGIAAIRCRLEAMDSIVRGASPASLGGAAFVRRLARRIDRALTFVRAAELIEATPRRLKKARRQMTRFMGQLGRGRATGRVAPELGDPLGSLAQDSVGRLDGLAAGG